MRATKRGRGARNGAPASAARRAGSKGAIAELQRLRMLSAMASACRELGAGRVSVVDVVSRAGVSRRTFYEAFKDRDECLAAALEEGLRRASEQVIPAYRAHKAWREAIRAGVEAFLGFVDADRRFGGLIVIDWLAAGDHALARRAQALSVLATELDRGRHPTRAHGCASRSCAEGAIGGALAILHSRLLMEPDRAVGPLAGELTGALILPYLGAAAAAREAKRRSSRRLPAPDADILADLDVRLTERTLLALRALATCTNDSPGMTNREVGAAAGVTDQGQISKLLHRLADRGLIVNARRSARNAAAPNAWRLTAKGAKLERAARR